ncbi:hypothetical protein HJG60_010084 [Phyllostomus discolor]|uniref:Uncharacterized protein n=1 Tax=Phyllostomus discolor TaxID=89673 RepID=A0A834B1Y9_9CHIR|nr:hypothetical protein HJG60_010084 [Phyllostomus discolor]
MCVISSFIFLISAWTMVKLDIFSFKKAISFSLCSKSATNLPMRSVKSFTNGSKREKSFFRLYTFGFRSLAKVTVFRTLALSLSRLKNLSVCLLKSFFSSESTFLTELILCEFSAAVFRSIAVRSMLLERSSPMFFTVFFSTFSILFSSSCTDSFNDVISVTKPEIRRISVFIVVVLRPISFAMEIVFWSTFVIS